MDSLNAEQHTYDWDNISVGCSQVEHSQNFFERKHFEHERNVEMEFLQQKMTETEISDNKENISGCSPTAVLQKIEENLVFSPPSNLLDAIQEKFLNNGVPSLQVYPDFDDDLSTKKSKIESIDSTADVNKGVPSLQVNSNLAVEWSTKKPKAESIKGARSKNMPPPPQAYLAKNIYKKKREEAERRRTEEERKMREFRSRPAPSFNHYTLLQKRKPVHVITMPSTPQVLKKSRETEEKRRKKLEEWKQKNQPPKFEPRPATVLKEKPFVPEKKSIAIQQQPFNLHMEKRLQERRHYDEIRRKTMEEKRKQVDYNEEEREKQEKERIRELRKAATFKARPNPFKN